jgi:PLP dependent protein
MMESFTHSISERYRSVIERVARAARGAGRDPGEVTVVAVAKTFSAAAVAEAIDAGVAHIGENRAQELREKVAVIGDRVTWHFVGHLQTNKVRHVVGVVELLHSLDRFGLAEAVARRARSARMVQDVLIEVNSAGEVSKSGVEPARALDLARRVAALEGIRVRGFMTIPPLSPDPEDTRPFYRTLAELRDQASSSLPEATELSMGMTHDLEIAIAEGATLIRVGEAIFGPRG